MYTNQEILEKVRKLREHYKNGSMTDEAIRSEVQRLTQELKNDESKL